MDSFMLAAFPAWHSPFERPRLARKAQRPCRALLETMATTGTTAYQHLADVLGLSNSSLTTQNHEISPSFRGYRDCLKASPEWDHVPAHCTVPIGPLNAQDRRLES